MKSMMRSEGRYEVAKARMMIGKKEMCSTGNYKVECRNENCEVCWCAVVCTSITPRGKNMTVRERLVGRNVIIPITQKGLIGTWMANPRSYGGQETDN